MLNFRPLLTLDIRPELSQGLLKLLTHLLGRVINSLMKLLLWHCFGLDLLDTLVQLAPVVLRSVSIVLRTSTSIAHLNVLFDEVDLAIRDGLGGQDLRVRESEVFVDARVLLVLDVLGLMVLFHAELVLLCLLPGFPEVGFLLIIIVLELLIKILLMILALLDDLLQMILFILGRLF